MRITFVAKRLKNKNVAAVVVAEKKVAAVETVSGRKLIKVGVAGKINHRKLRVLARQIIFLAKSNRIKQISISFSDFIFKDLNLTPEDVAETLGIDFEVANFEFNQYKTKPKEGWAQVEQIIVIGNLPRSVKGAFSKGQTIGSAVNDTRILANTPGGEMTPKLLADSAKKAAVGTKVRVNILGVSDIKELGMGGILGVASGSKEEPRFIIMEYWGGEKSEKPVVLVGKGVTFDTGGINLKPSEHINDMHMDMSGGAAVIQALVLAAKLGLAKNVVGLIPAVENMPSGSSYRPGDILRTMSGKTIEVLNTDAEGRIILADALTYAKEYKPRLVVDVATLTGAAAAALGQRASAIFTRDTNLETQFRNFGEESGDYVWPLPLWEEYEDEVRGTFADWANIGKTRYGGAIHGAVFLYQWAKDYLWVHIDIAPRMTPADGEFLAKGSVGAPVRLLAKLLEKY